MQSNKTILLLAAAGMTFGAFSVQAGDKATHADNKAAPADNTDVNDRDRSGATLTPEDQSQSKGDIELAARVRRAVIDHDGVSMDGKNIKIITINNAVTLRGPVKDAAERTAIEKTVRVAAGTSATVDNQLEVR